MFRYYEFSEGRAIESDSFNDNCLITVVDPSENELRELSERFGIEMSRLQAATDIEEPSMWEKDNENSYLIIDVPYKDESDNYDTVPMMVISCPNAVITLCEKKTNAIPRFLKRYSKYLDMNDKYGFEIRLIYAITKEYQQDLRDIDSQRRALENKIKKNLERKDVAALHELENSLVYFITSLKGCNAILDLMRHDHSNDLDKFSKNLFQTVSVENKQSVEMATVYKEIVSNTRDLLSTEINLKLNLTMQVLAVFTILLTIPMVVTGAYGMNVDLPLQDKKWAFDAIFLGTMFITVSLCIYFRKKHIL